MTHAHDTNEEIWKSESGVAHWMSGAAGREARRRAQWRLMGELLPFADDAAFTFADLGAGTGAAARAVLDVFPNSSVVLGEYSPQMIAEGETAMAQYAGRYRYVEFDLLSSVWPAEMPERLSAIVTSQCVHHLPDDRKATLFSEIFAHLEPSGWYLNYDPVRAEDDDVEAASTRANDREDPEAAAQAAHPDPDEARRHANHVRHIAPLAPQIAMLSAAGFGAIDVYWKQCDVAVFGGMRPAR